MLMVSAHTAATWARRYQVERPATMGDPSSRPHLRPIKTSTAVVKKIAALRWHQRHVIERFQDRNSQK